MERGKAIHLLKIIRDGYRRCVDEAHANNMKQALDMAIEALSADVVSREEAIQAVDKCRERKNKEIEQLREFYSQKPTIPCFAESAEAYKAWTGEEMGKTNDEINEMNKEIIKDILKMMPTAYLLEALGVSTFEELTDPADRPHGEWIIDTYNMELKCGICGEIFRFDDVDELLDYKEYAKYCLACGSKMGGDGE